MQRNVSDAAAAVGEFVEVLNSGDWDALLEQLHPDFEYDLTRTTSPLRGIYGRSQMRRVLEEFLGSWESWRYEPHEFVEKGNQVVVPFTTHFRGRDGIEMTTDAVWLWTIRDGRLTRVALFQDRAEAMDAAGAA